jgi:hypothetical protein
MYPKKKKKPGALRGNEPLLNSLNPSKKRADPDQFYRTELIK